MILDLAYFVVIDVAHASVVVGYVHLTIADIIAASNARFAVFVSFKIAFVIAAVVFVAVVDVALVVFVVVAMAVVAAVFLGAFFFVVAERVRVVFLVVALFLVVLPVDFAAAFEDCGFISTVGSNTGVFSFAMHFT